MSTAIMSTSIMGIITTDELFWRAVAGAAMLGAVAGPIGCFVLWRRMAYLGASIAEMALLGAALGLILRIDPLWGVLATSLTAALLLARPWSASLAARSSLIPADTSIGLIGHAGLALGFIALSSLETVRADLLGYLFGDVLALSADDLVLIGVLGAVALAGLGMIWRPLLADTISPEILAAEAGAARGIRAQGVFLALVAGLIAFGLKVVGALLIVALIIIPPAAARPFARTPEAMAILAALIGAVSAPLGLVTAFAYDLPAGPAIVLAATAIFILSNAVSQLVQRRTA
jgi:zinc transport system permease protein